ncbi:MAG: M56 family metallopeptidase [Isosphaeraceae bacterium]
MLWWIAETSLVAAALALAAGAASRFRPLGPAARHALWLVVVLKLVTPPLVQSPWALPVRAAESDQEVVVREKAEPAEVRVDEPFALELVRAEEFEPAEVNGLVPAMNGNPLLWLRRVSRETHATGPVEPEGVESTLTADAAVSLEPASPRPARPAVDASVLGFWLLSAWGVVTACLAAVQGVRLARFSARLREATPAPRWIVIELEVLAERMGVRAPEALAVPGLGVPMVWCLGRPKLLLPTHLLKSLSVDRWRGVLAHELAHVKRGDPWVARLVLLAGLVWWWNPVFRLARRRLEAEAELACDAWVVWALPADRVVYAGTMLDLCESLCRKDVPRLAPALGVSGAGRIFERRLTMILSDRVPCRLSLPGLIAPGLLALTGFPSWTAAAPSAVAVQADEPAAKATATVTVTASDDDDRAEAQKARAERSRAAAEKARAAAEAARAQIEKNVVVLKQRAELEAELAKARAKRDEARRLVRSDADPALKQSEARVKELEAKAAELSKNAEKLNEARIVLSLRQDEARARAEAHAKASHDAARAHMDTARKHMDEQIKRLEEKLAALDRSGEGNDATRTSLKKSIEGLRKAKDSIGKGNTTVRTESRSFIVKKDADGKVTVTSPEGTPGVGVGEARVFLRKDGDKDGQIVIAKPGKDGETLIVGPDGKTIGKAQVRVFVKKDGDKVEEVVIGGPDQDKKLGEINVDGRRVIRREVRVEKRGDKEGKKDDDDDDDDKDVEIEIGELTKLFAPGSELMKGLEKLGPELEKQLREKLGPGSEFDGKMKELGTKLGKELKEKLGPGSEFEKAMKELAKSLEKQFGPGSEFEKQAREFGAEIEKRMKEAREVEKKAETKPEPKFEVKRDEKPKEAPAAKARERARARVRDRRVQELEARIKALTKELEKAKSDAKDDKDEEDDDDKSESK